MGSGELVSREQLARWRERGLIRAIPLPSGARPVRAEEPAAVRAGVFTGFAPLLKDNSVVPVTRARSIE